MYAEKSEAYLVQQALNYDNAAYAFFRQIRPEGRWILWLQGSDGVLIGADSRMWGES